MRLTPDIQFLRVGLAWKTDAWHTNGLSFVSVLSSLTLTHVWDRDSIGIEAIAQQRLSFLLGVLRARWFDNAESLTRLNRPRPIQLRLPFGVLAHPLYSPTA